ncbi:formate dehydrogenase [Arcobacter vandammei]|uniref:formate dehydrogenase n=1 Tax=Arcobacter vandammei TaxID=2782243 RepID=UPI0018E02143|nr:formate dehydrogenase [Arcobacter vandammei]
MADELEQRRQFIKRAAIASTVLAGSVVATAATTERQDRGATSSKGNGVVVGRSTKKEILYKKSAAWEEFYNSTN